MVSASTCLRQRLEDFYRATVPGYPLGFKGKTSAQMHRWLDEWQLKHDQMQPHCSTAVCPLPGRFYLVQSDGGLELLERNQFSALPEGAWFATASFIVRDTNPSRMQKPSNRTQAQDWPPIISAYKSDGEWLFAKMSAEDDLLVVVSYVLVQPFHSSGTAGSCSSAGQIWNHLKLMIISGDCDSVA